jgi:hypothetical protein
MISVITLELSDLTVQLINDGTVLLWAEGDTSREADVSVTLNDLRRIIQAADLMVQS